MSDETLGDSHDILIKDYIVNFGNRGNFVKSELFYRLLQLRFPHSWV